MSIDQTARRSLPLLDVQGLSVRLQTADGPVLILDQVSFAVRPGSTMALVGESGCGKSMTCLAIMGLLPPRATVSGTVSLAGVDLMTLPEVHWERTRGREIAMVFQDPSSALNPVLTIGLQIVEGLARHRGLTSSAARSEARRLLDLVQMPAAARRLDEYPHELSGGMCQRAMIAIAIACNPRVLIADEPTTALDVTVQAQILALLREIQAELGMALIIVTHDLGVVAHTADDAAVMYAGCIVERASVRELFERPLHPYTQALFAALPHRIPAGERLLAIPGAVPTPTSRPSGCAFRTRCVKADAGCAAGKPALMSSSATRSVACYKTSDTQAAA